MQPHPVNLRKGNAVQLVATGYDIVSNPQHGTVFTWASDNTAIATVTAAGVVTAVKEGRANITATSSGSNGSTLIYVGSRDQ